MSKTDVDLYGNKKCGKSELYEVALRFKTKHKAEDFISFLNGTIYKDHEPLRKVNPDAHPVEDTGPGC